jgi:peptide/nickel transport system substrate-binding protein
MIGNANLSPVDPTKFSDAHYATGGFYNTANLSLPAFDALVEKIPTATDPRQHYDMVKQASQMIVDSQAIVWTARPLTVVPVPDHTAAIASIRLNTSTCDTGNSIRSKAKPG